MRLLAQLRHPQISVMTGTLVTRRAARGIVLRDERILLLYTERYNDYSFPGGGLEADEDLVDGLRRELAEETGATGIRVVESYGVIDELRRHHRPEYELMRMFSYFYLCEIDQELSAPRLEHYERANGMRPMWLPITEAIHHNRTVMARREASMGLSIEPDTLALEMVARELCLLRGGACGGFQSIHPARTREGRRPLGRRLMPCMRRAPSGPGPPGWPPFRVTTGRARASLEVQSDGLKAKEWAHRPGNSTLGGRI